MFITEETLPGFMHACTVDEVIRVLSALPSSDWSGIHAIAFRQLTRKERMLSPRWGHIEFAPTQDGVAHAATIYLIAPQPSESLVWPASLVPADVAELAQLRRDGHDVTMTDRGWKVTSTIEAVQRTQLCRTIPHEIGHWVHYRMSVLRGEDHEAKTTAAKEGFAEQYAAKVHSRVAAAFDDTNSAAA
ncbi:MAG TPA: hypothetical protein VJ276_18045 [Thermoanaerobaculia bacterium]|nr:hypothetical protein [Thermoanaerobaculia bacterium]